MARWNPSLHPRDGNGRFKPKFSQSVRLSPISVSYNVGVRVPIVPGRANLYVGGLARVERAGGSKFLKGATDRIVNRVAKAFGDRSGSSNLSQILKGNEINANGLKISGPRNVINTPTFRVTSSPASRENGTVQRVRRRAPRQNRLARGRTPNLTGAVRTTPAIARPRPSRTRSRTAISGRRSRR